ncbi:RNA-binding protein [Candidatus Uhrbacteria bacterium CG_4_10_14_0_8_um_filter_58_22]|uniref:RNA-binding protein KhpA n=1 Tax=Candidatus Uhrbacteria bacterium CG_4_10_14_0_8_um_filter_58_22 TaxID=1975029 RepID=A0A2M7Q8R3_9BACT|nr:MAG: RNA-binding protein [Parcubacteria group bacterium CG1_02_58_44]PIY61901.1 MAG: RNA-binding protein [Candidatus Uhrbacteria bacterium CG_4_10_14_0_8_um_filter_58_22]
MSEEFFDREFVEYVVKAIVNHPGDVRAERSIDERGVLITLYVNPEDMGYVIGKSGQTARSIRTLLKIVGAKNNARVNLKIYEPEGSRKFPSAVPAQSAPPAPAFDEDEDIDTSAVDLKI